MIEAPSRRDRVRAATTGEIKQTARRILVARGPDAVSLRAIAREMGMTAPALYRYFASHEDLLRHVVADIFTEIADDIQPRHPGRAQASRRRHGGQAGRRVRRVPPLVARASGRVRPALRHPAAGPGSGARRRDRRLRDELQRLLLRAVRSCGSSTRSPSPPTTRSSRACARSLPATSMGSASTCRSARPDLPALLGPALRHGQPGGLRPPGLRAGRPGPHVRDHPDRAGLAASSIRFPADRPRAAATKRPRGGEAGARGHQAARSGRPCLFPWICAMITPVSLGSRDASPWHVRLPGTRSRL